MRLAGNNMRLKRNNTLAPPLPKGKSSTNNFLHNMTAIDFPPKTEADQTTVLRRSGIVVAMFESDSSHVDVGIPLTVCLGELRMGRANAALVGFGVWAYVLEFVVRRSWSIGHCDRVLECHFSLSSTEQVTVTVTPCLDSCVTSLCPPDPTERNK